MKQLYKYCGLATGVALLLILHFYRLGELPGLHYDEAWAMNYAWRIASQRDFWPLTAMSPYTAPWAHYWAAIWLKSFGPSVFIFRSSQVTLSLLGLVALCFSLPRHIRSAFPWAVLLVPGLFLNHRFSIELNGFHVFCFGLLCLALRKELPLLAVLASFLGSTAHILFYGATLALLGTAFLEKVSFTSRQRRAAFVYFLLMAIFFTKVAWEIPEKGKGLALVASSGMAIGLLLLRAERWKVWGQAWPRLFLRIGALIFLFNSLFFAQGFWGASLFTGFGPQAVSYEVFLLVLGLAGLILQSILSFRVAPRFALTWYFMGTLFLGLMMLKPAPRYFELSLLGLAALLCWHLWDWIYQIEWPISRRLCWLTVLSGFLGLNLGFSGAKIFLFPSRESQLSFLFFKDSSRDFLDKQSLVRFLGGSGCSLSDIHSNDPRLMETLKALALGDWPLDQSRPCVWNYVSRKSEAGGTGEPFGEFLLRRKH